MLESVSRNSFLSRLTTSISKIRRDMQAISNPRVLAISSSDRSHSQLPEWSICALRSTR